MITETGWTWREVRRLELRRMWALMSFWAKKNAPPAPKREKLTDEELMARFLAASEGRAR